ncbi:MAG: histidine kinase [Pseudomonadota bacterium]
MPSYLIPLLLLACAVPSALLLVCMRRMRRRLEHRARAAAALHDTLLQSIQGMILRFQSVAHRLPPGSAERETIETILDQADEVLAEARHQIVALRRPDPATPAPSTPPNRA